jgi:hypothetical protein
MCPIPNGFPDRAVSLNRSKIVGKKERLPTVSNTGIYCSSDSVGTVYLVKYVFENCAANINALTKSWEGMACCSSECILTFLHAGDNMKPLYLVNLSE